LFNYTSSAVSDFAGLLAGPGVSPFFLDLYG
jgi:hypothetical protein